MNYEDIKTSKYYLHYCSGAGRGTWFIERLSDGALTMRETGSEGKERYQRLKRLWRQNPALFDEAVASEHQFMAENGMDVTGDVS